MSDKFNRFLLWTMIILGNTTCGNMASNGLGPGEHIDAIDPVTLPLTTPKPTPPLTIVRFQGVVEEEVNLKDVKIVLGKIYEGEEEKEVVFKKPVTIEGKSIIVGSATFEEKLTVRGQIDQVIPWQMNSEQPLVATSVLLEWVELSGKGKFELKSDKTVSSLLEDCVLRNIDLSLFSDDFSRLALRRSDFFSTRISMNFNSDINKALVSFESNNFIFSTILLKDLAMGWGPIEFSANNFLLMDTETQRYFNLQTEKGIDKFGWHLQQIVNNNFVENINSLFYWTNYTEYISSFLGQRFAAGPGSNIEVGLPNIKVKPIGFDLVHGKRYSIVENVDTNRYETRFSNYTLLAMIVRKLKKETERLSAAISKGEMRMFLTIEPPEDCERSESRWRDFYKCEKYFTIPVEGTLVYHPPKGKEPKSLKIANKNFVLSNNPIENEARVDAITSSFIADFADQGQFVPIPVVHTPYL